MDSPTLYNSAITYLGVASVSGLTCAFLYGGALRAGLGRTSAVRLTVAAVLLIGGWFAASAAITEAGGYRAGIGQQPPWLPIAVVGVLATLLATTRIPTVAATLRAPGMQSRLVLPHMFRVAGVSFLISMALGHLPALFAIPAGVGDIAVGLSAPRVARRLAQGTGHRDALWFNALGITDLTVALALGGLTGYQIVHVSPTSNAIGELPLALIPTAAVPLFLALHITSIRQLRGTVENPHLTATPAVAHS